MYRVASRFDGLGASSTTDYGIPGDVLHEYATYEPGTTGTSSSSAGSSSGSSSTGSNWPLYVVGGVVALGAVAIGAVALMRR